MKRLKLAVVSNEFMAPGIGRTGGFGWAARAVARSFAENPGAGVDVVYLTGEITAPDGRRETDIAGTRLLFRRKPQLALLPALLREQIDMILTVDFRPSYHALLRMMPRTPVVVWARDPRTPEDIRRIESLRIPGQDGVRPKGIERINCSMAKIARQSRLLRRPLLIASKFPHIAGKLVDTYGVSSPYLLPNPDVLDYDTIERRKHPTPRVVFLARLDPYKRPWLFVELARRFPQAEFLMLGRPHFNGAGAWQPADLPANLRMMGHVDGPEKLRLLASSWVLVNTSIYEESPVSMLEALACETPILSCLDSGELATRFGVYAGRADGSGLQALPALEAGLRHLLADGHGREALGRAGRAWVMANHNDDRFLKSFRILADAVGLGGRGGHQLGPAPAPAPGRAGASNEAGRPQ